MAQFNADILLQVQTSGEQRLNKIKSSVEQLNRLSQSLKPLNLLAPGGGKLGDSVRKAIKPIKDFAREATNGTAKYANTLAGATSQAQVFETVLRNVKVAAGGYSAQVGDVKNLANAYAQAANNADVYGKRLTTLQNDAIRLSKNYQTQTEREIQLSQRQIRLLELRAQKQRAADLRQRASTGAQNALIGGAFPLLFGQGPAAAIGGGLGGLAGGLLGGQFGFALSLVGTALGDAVNRSEEFNRSVAGLNGSLSRSSSVLRITTSDIEELAKQLSITNDEAIDLVGTFSAFDDPKAAKELARAFADVGGVQTFEAIAGIKDEKTAVETIAKLRGVIGNELAEQLLKQVELEGSQASSVALLDAVLSKQEKITEETQKTVTLWDRILSAFALSGATVINPNELTPEAIAQDRADAVPELDRGLIDRYEKNLKRINAIRDRLLKKYTPERTRKTKDTSARDLAQSQGVLRQLQQQLAVAQANEGLDSSILRISQNYENTLKRIGQLKDQSLAKEQAQAALQIRNAQINKAVQDFEEKRAESIDRVFKTLQNERAELLATTDLQKDNLRVQQIVEQLERSKIFLNDKQLQQLRDLIAGNRQLAQEKQTQLFLDQQLEAAINGIGRQAAGLMETLITGTDDWAASLNNALKSLASLLFNVGLSALGGGDNRGFFSILSGDFKVGARAKGGPVTSGSPYVVGEKGPELFVPGRSGAIVPNDAMGGGVNSVVNVNISDSGVSTDASQGAALGREINSAVTAILIRERRPGGLLSR